MALLKQKKIVAQPESALLNGQIDQVMVTFRNMTESLMGIVNKANTEKAAKEEEIKALQLEKEALDAASIKAQQMANKLNSFFEV